MNKQPLYYIKQTMKQRLTSIDGLRGFAALSVVISHIGINLQPIIEFPIINFFFRIISSGTTAVQLFFVLSGFLIGYLYPTISNNLQYLCKRYLRIIPLYGTIVFYIWWTQFHNSGNLWESLYLLIKFAVIVHLVWRFLKRLQPVFYIFIFFQLGFFIFSLTLMPHLISGGNLNNFQKETIYMLSNLSMTMYLQKRLVVLSGVFWSLVPEMLFYLFYPFIILPIINWLSQKKDWLILIFSLASIKILFDLDAASRSFYSVHGIFIARACGFVIGLAIGRIFLSQNLIWKKLEKIISRPIINLAILVTFFTALGLELPDRYYQIREYVAFHFLGISLIFGLTLAAALVVNSLTNRLFSNKVFVFLGMISYSLYLIHGKIIDKLNWSPFWLNISSQLTVERNNLAKIIIFGGLSIIIAWLLYWLIERLYFVYKKTELQVSASDKTKLTFRQIIVPVFLASVIIMWVYAGDYSPSIIVVRPKINILTKEPFKFSFKASEKNLSVILLPLDYARNPANNENETKLVFTLMDENNETLFSSDRSAQQVEGVPMYPFGFPSQVDSKGKKYSVSLSLENSLPSDEIHVNKNFGVVTQYTTEKSQNITYLINLIYKRLIFVLSFPQVRFALIILGCLFLI